MIKCAILFAGCGNLTPEGNAPRYRNDLAYMYSVLVNKLNYDKNNVDVLLADGKQMDGKFHADFIKTKPGTYTNFKKTIEKYKNLKSEDQLFIMISNHGGPLPSGEKCIIGFVQYENVHISVSAFEKMVNELVCKKIIIMGQCYGGNFLDIKLKNSIIISANLPDGLSYAIPDFEYDEFLYHFISYFNDKKCRDSNMSISSAFEYARKNDRFSNMLSNYDVSENPQKVENGLCSSNTYL